MTTIADMVQQVDQPVSDVTELRVFHLVNADPSELADQFSLLFPDDTRSGQNDNQNRFRFNGGGRFGGGGQQAASATGTTDRTRKKSRVLAVADARTSSLIITAASEMMPQIAEMIAQLDSSPAKRERVAVFDLQNADPQDVSQVLQDLFNRNNSMRANSSSSRSMLGQNNPLTQRATQQQNTTTTTSRFGTSSRSSGGGAGGF